MNRSRRQTGTHPMYANRSFCFLWLSIPQSNGTWQKSTNNSLTVMPMYTMPRLFSPRYETGLCFWFPPTILVDNHIGNTFAKGASKDGSNIFFLRPFASFWAISFQVSVLSDCTHIACTVAEFAPATEWKVKTWPLSPPHTISSEITGGPRGSV